MIWKLPLNKTIFKMQKIEVFKRIKNTVEVVPVPTGRDDSNDQERAWSQAACAISGV